MTLALARVAVAVAVAATARPAAAGFVDSVGLLDVAHRLGQPDARGTNPPTVLVAVGVAGWWVSDAILPSVGVAAGDWSGPPAGGAPVVGVSALDSDAVRALDPGALRADVGQDGWIGRPPAEPPGGVVTPVGELAEPVPAPPAGVRVKGGNPADGRSAQGGVMAPTLAVVVALVALAAVGAAAGVRWPARRPRRTRRRVRRTGSSVAREPRADAAGYVAHN